MVYLYPKIGFYSTRAMNHTQILLESIRPSEALSLFRLDIRKIFIKTNKMANQNISIQFQEKNLVKELSLYSVRTPEM